MLNFGNVGEKISNRVKIGHLGQVQESIDQEDLIVQRTIEEIWELCLEIGKLELDQSIRVSID